ncbi:MAG: rod shape-determining protein MreC [Calditrichia bacterium]
MKNIFGLFSRRSSLLLLGFYIILSFVIMTFNDQFTLRGMRFTVLQVVSWVNSVENKFRVLGSVTEENKELRKKVIELSTANQRLQEIMIENIRLRRLLQLKRESNFNFMAANVIGLSQEQSVRSLILNVGSADSVRKNMPVVTDRGLVGKLLIVEPHQSIMQILMDRNSLVSARLQRSREIGVVGWSGNLWLDLNYIPRDIKVEPGEAVVTSGLSRIYPEGIKIGVVGEVQDNEYELFKTIKIKPAVEFNSIENVFVVLTPDSMNMEIARSE